jgi:hypothetical protein
MRARKMTAAATDSLTLITSIPLGICLKKDAVMSQLVAIGWATGIQEIALFH